MTTTTYYESTYDDKYEYVTDWVGDTYKLKIKDLKQQMEKAKYNICEDSMILLRSLLQRVLYEYS